MSKIKVSVEFDSDFQMAEFIIALRMGKVVLDDDLKAITSMVCRQIRKQLDDLYDEVEPND